MRISSSYISAVITLLLMPVVAQSQVYQCNGIWTNKPCEGREPEQVLNEPSLRASHAFTERDITLENEAKESVLESTMEELVSPERKYALWRISRLKQFHRTSEAESDFAQAVKTTKTLCSDSSLSDDVCLQGLGVLLAAWAER